MIRHLHDVAGLEALEKIARDHDVDIVARGGLARRLHAVVVRTPTVSPDLFDLLPFTADIELTHTGGPELDGRIMDAIHREVPLAECFRWGLRSAAAEADALAARAYGPVVPVHAVTVGVREGFADPMQARGDLERRRHRYVRNPAYAGSPRYEAGLDLEVFGALRYLRTIFDDDAVDPTDVKALDEVRATILDAMSLDTLGRLQESVHLRMRLHALLKAVSVAARSPAARALVETVGVRSFVGYVDGDADPRPRVAEPPGAALAEAPGTPPPVGAVRMPFRDDLDLQPISAIVASAHLRGDLFRLPARIPFYWPVAPSPSAAPTSPHRIVRDDAFVAPGVQVLRVSSWLPVAPGVAAASRSADGVINEMIHFATITDGDPGNAPDAPNDEDLGVTMLFRRGLAPATIEIASPLATCVSRPYERDDGSTTTVRSYRLACGSLVERLAESDEGGTLYIAFVMAARVVAESESQPAWRTATAPVPVDVDVPVQVGVRFR